ncbi:hypothetical protein NX009_06135 [Klebsiella pneumoniae]|nr:hypothetical protein [Klebsiella pneumoniae]
MHGIQWLGYTLHFPDWLTVFLAQGIGGGINTVLPLVPQIGMMYLFLSFLEDSGYMARAAFVMDRLMQALGLPGKSFVPLIVGFGCNVPSVMGARTLDAPRERLMTIMMAPFMSCGARLAIFAVFAAAFFGQNGALAVFSLYVLGIVMAILTYPDAEAHHYARRSLAVRDGAAGVPRPAYQEPDYPDLAAPERLCAARREGDRHRQHLPQRAEQLLTER